MKESLKKNLSSLLPVLLPAALASILLGLCALYLTVLPYDGELVGLLWRSAELLFLNTWPIFCLMVVCYGLSGRFWISFLLSAGVTFTLAEVNRFKIYFRDDPLVCSDLLLFGEARKMVEQYKLFLDQQTLYALIFLAVLFLAVLVLSRRYSLRLKGWKLRTAAALLAAAAFAGSCQYLYFENPNHTQLWNPAFGNEWKSANQYMSRGCVYSFLSSVPQASYQPPAGYDEDAVESLLSDYPAQDMEDEEKVSLICVMLEAYNDFTVFEGIEFLQDPYENFHRIQSQSYCGSLYTNIFAAGTTQTEWAFLTGYNDLNLKKRDTESFVWYLRSQGYRTEAMHPGYGWFYDRRNVNSFFGFESFLYEENAFQEAAAQLPESMTYHDLLADVNFFDYIIAGHQEAAEQGVPYFNFSVTYQNHGPYALYPEYSQPLIAKNASCTEEDYAIINNYLSGIAWTDIALGKLFDYVSTSPQPIALVLFGDHNPWLGDSNSVYTMLGIDLDLGTSSGSANYYQTPYVIYANDAAKKSLGASVKGTGETVSPMFLMSEVFQALEIQGGSSYLQYLKQLKQTYTVLNPVFLKKNGVYYQRSELPSDETRQIASVMYYFKNQPVSGQ